ncbi:techylectin-5A-like isoform X3 [Dermacentor albipictus]|uniref:techylectin-5A-like isoform X3 n=1 Tax=Dermacentor albipictus TaxID=60249 RepID=UPI0031FBFB1A
MPGMPAKCQTAGAGWNLNRYSGKMDWRVPSISLMILYSALSASGVEAAVVAPPGLVQAEERMKELVDLFSDIRCSIRPRHCADNFQAGQTVSGLYKIFLGKDDVTGKVVYCDMDTDGGGWTVIQRRGQFGNSVYYFYRNWTEYATGFGDPAKEYWLGNRALHTLTSTAESMELKVVLTNHTGENISVLYESFKVGSEKAHFKLLMGSYFGPRGWDSLYNCNHSKFSTFDQDHDNTEYHCAEKYRGGWWYNNCHSANLNGLNLNGPHDSYADGIEWSIRNGVGFLYHYSYPSVTMMIRPVTLNKNHESGYL